MPKSGKANSEITSQFRFLIPVDIHLISGSLKLKAVQYMHLNPSLPPDNNVNIVVYY